MEYRTTKDGISIPVLGLGTWNIGGQSTPDTSRDPENIEVIRKAIEMGYRHIDTAEVYAAGHSEELVGRAIKDIDRGELFITTKVDPAHLGKDNVEKALDGSLKRLQIDYVDLYLIHWPNESIPLSESFAALNRQVALGKIRHLGVSNFSVAQLTEAREHSETPVVTNQVPFGLNDRSYVTNGVLDYCRTKGILFTAYSPIKKGSLESDTVKRIAGKYGATAAQIVLAWIFAQEPVITIPKSTDAQHLKENIDALQINIDSDDIDLLSSMS